MFDDPFQLEMFPEVLQLNRIDLSCNMRRFYRITVRRDLFGQVELVREWGRIGTKGQMLVERYDDQGSAVSALMKLAAAKKRRGYVLGIPG